MTQRNLRKTVAGVSQNKRVRAIALEVINGRATVKIAGSSRPLYGLPVTGGEVVAGQEVFVDYISGQPVVSSYRESAPMSKGVSRIRTRMIIPDPDVPLSGSDHTHTESQITDLIHSATKIRGRTITTGSPVDGDTMSWDEETSEWIYGSVISSISIILDNFSTLCDGTKKLFTTSKKFISGSTRAFLNGLLQEEGKDYNESANCLNIVFDTAPFTSDSLLIQYMDNGPSSLFISGPYTAGSILDHMMTIQLHDHTTESDGNLSPEELVLRYLNDGVGGLAITDHNLMTTQPAGMTLAINGDEVTQSYGHLGAIGITKLPTGSSVQTYIDSILADNGIAILNHPKWTTGFSLATMQSLTGYHGIEIFNMHVQKLTGTGFDIVDWDALLSGTRHNIWGFATDDFHSKVFNTASNTGRIHVFAKSNSLTDVLDSIRAGNFVADVSNYGITPKMPIVTREGISIDVPGATGIKFIGSTGELQSTSGSNASYQFSQTDDYVRIEAIGDYTEPFDEAIDQTNRWSNVHVTGSWITGGGVLTEPLNEESMIWCNRHVYGDFEASVMIKGTAAAPDRAGLTFHGTDTDKYFVIRLTAGNALQIVNQAGSTLAAAGFTSGSGIWYHLKVDYTKATGVYRGKAWADGDSEPDWMITYNGGATQNGMFGLRTWKAMQFDNLYIDGFTSYYQPIPVGDWQ